MGRRPCFSHEASYENGHLGCHAAAIVVGWLLQHVQKSRKSATLGARNAPGGKLHLSITLAIGRQTARAGCRQCARRFALATNRRAERSNSRAKFQPATGP